MNLNKQNRISRELTNFLIKDTNNMFYPDVMYGKYKMLYPNTKVTLDDIEEVLNKMPTLRKYRGYYQWQTDLRMPWQRGG